MQGQDVPYPRVVDSDLKHEEKCSSHWSSLSACLPVYLALIYTSHLGSLSERGVEEEEGETGISPEGWASLCAWLGLQDFHCHHVMQHSVSDAERGWHGCYGCVSTIPHKEIALNPGTSVVLPASTARHGAESTEVGTTSCWWAYLLVISE